MFVGHHESMARARVFRHRPFLVVTGACLLLVGFSGYQIVGWVVGHHDFASVVKAFLLLMLLLAFALFLVAFWRVRTVVDDGGVTQYWISRSYRMAYEEITAIELDHAYRRWFLRVRCGERTFEVIPCHTFSPFELSSAARPPRAILAVHRAIEEAWPRELSSP